MPMFEYECQKCGHKMDFLEKSSSKDKHICEKCGSDNMKKLLSGFSVSVGAGSSSGSSCPTGTCPFS